MGDRSIRTAAGPRVGVRLSHSHGFADDTQTTIGAGETYELPASLASSITLTAAPGDRTFGGAVLDVSAGSVSASYGVVLLQGGESADELGTPAGGPGATLLNDGTLSNSGVITVAGGTNGNPGLGGQGAALINAGVLTNSGSIKAGGGYGGTAAGSGGAGALVSNTGVLTNTGTLTLGTSFGGNDPPATAGTGATLLDSGVLMNAGLLEMDGSTGGAALTVTSGGYLSNSGLLQLYNSDFSTVGGAVLTDDGKVENAGTISLFGGGNINGGTGALLVDNGVLTNNGYIDLGGSFYFGDLHGPAATLTVSGTLINQSNIYLGRALYYTPPGQMTVAATGTLLNGGVVAGVGDLVNLGVVAGYGASLDTLSLAHLVNDGVIESGAKMQIDGAIDANTGFSGRIDVSDGGTLALNGNVGTDQILDFDGTTGWLDLATPSSFAAAIDGFSTGDVLDLTGLAFVAGHMSESFADGVLTVSDGAQADSFVLNGVPDDTQFALRNDGSQSHGTLIEEAAQCYVPGTRLRTDRGDISVEDLVIGDRLVTLHGGLKPIRWIGHRSYDGRFIADNHLMLPVCIKADALAPDVPRRDLRVSPGHGVYVDGVLIPAWRLVNGVTITQDSGIDRVRYIHVELAEHEIVFAEGLAAETYLDEGCRTQFANAADYGGLYPHDVAGPRPTPCVARIEDGFQLHAIQQRLSARAGIAAAASCNAGPLRGFLEVAGPDTLVGWAQDAADPEQPVCLDVVVDGRRILRLLANRYRADVRAAGLGSGCQGFDLRFATPVGGHIDLHRAGDGAVLDRTAGMAAERSG